MVHISALESIWEMSSTLLGMGEFRAGVLRSVKENERTSRLRTKPRAQRGHPRVVLGSIHELELRELVELQRVVGPAVLPVHHRGVLRRPDHPEVITNSRGKVHSLPVVPPCAPVQPAVVAAPSGQGVQLGQRRAEARGDRFCGWYLAEPAVLDRGGTDGPCLPAL